jgi:hypothetical protein
VGGSDCCGGRRRTPRAANFALRHVLMRMVKPSARKEAQPPRTSGCHTCAAAAGTPLAVTGVLIAVSADARIAWSGRRASMSWGQALAEMHTRMRQLAAALAGQYGVGSAPLQLSPHAGGYRAAACAHARRRAPAPAGAPRTAPCRHAVVARASSSAHVLLLQCTEEIVDD